MGQLPASVFLQEHLQLHWHPTSLRTKRVRTGSNVRM